MSTCIFVLFVTLNVVDCGGTFYCELVKMLWPNNQATTSDKTLETVPFIFSFTVFSPGRGLAGFPQEKTEMAH